MTYSLNLDFETRATVDLIGRVFGRWRVLRAIKPRKKHARYIAECSCGVRRVVYAGNLKRGLSKSCGCYNAEQSRVRATRHGMRDHPAYRVWCHIIGRCYNASDARYADYGGRGIYVSPRWRNSFENFWTDMGPTYRTGLTIERKNNDGPYSKRNCAWISHAAQSRNTRRNRVVNTVHGRMLLCDAARLSGLGHSTILYRVKAGWLLADILKPIR
jgi:hypothetical protein